MLKALPHKADFERVLQTPIRSRSAHFAIHHVAGGPGSSTRHVAEVEATELSTGVAPVAPCPVDDLPAQHHWLGSVVPKRHARRSVTRSLLKRQIRAAMTRHLGALPPGLWLVRLRQPFVPKAFPSAASEALRHAARDELERLLQPLTARSASA